jgi:GH25 family lysozyme M1 (1,4-beta-N-acetylmuramidase)
MGKIKPYQIRRGDKGQTVKHLQIALGADPDGIFGPQTEELCKEAQSLSGLVADGIAGPMTLGALGLSVEAGIDVSHWQGKINWEKVKKAGIAFAYVKATEATTVEDSRFQSNVQLARSEDLIVGAYHFARPDTYADLSKPEKDARSEAENFLATYRPKSGDLIPCLDVEDGLGPHDTYNAQWILEWCRIVEKEIAKPMIYTAKWAVSKYLVDADQSLLDEISTFPVWWASYNKGLTPKRQPKRIWTEYDVWQYTGKGEIDGVKGKVDLNWSAAGALKGLLIP